MIASHLMQLLLLELVLRSWRIGIVVGVAVLRFVGCSVAVEQVLGIQLSPSTSERRVLLSAVVAAMQVVVAVAVGSVVVVGGGVDVAVEVCCLKWESVVVGWLLVDGSQGCVGWHR